LVKDFTSFCNRNCSADEHHDILGDKNLFFLNCPGWNELRSRLNPLFSISKLKNTFQLIKDIGAELNETMTSIKINEKTRSFCSNVTDLSTRYTIDVIASCAFGLEAKSLKFPNGDFITNGKRIWEFKLYRAIEFFSVFFFPELVSIFRFKVFSKESTEFLRESINYVMTEREASGIVRHDLIDTLISLKNEDKEKIQNSSSEIVFQGDFLVAQAAAFFAAGFETSASAMSFSIYELCWKPELQKRLRAEIKQVLIKSNDNIGYDDIQNMEYLNMVVQESLRMYPTSPILERVCTDEKGYSLEPFDNFVIPKGMPIIVPIHALQSDPKYFPNPNVFDPERFSAKNKNNINPYTFLPFGIGPRACIGDRFGLLQTKIGLVNFFKNHYVQPAECTPKVMVMEKKAFTLQAKGGVVLNVIRDPLI